MQIRFERFEHRGQNKNFSSETAYALLNFVFTKLETCTSSMFFSQNSSGLLKVGVAKSKSTAISPRDVKSGIFEGELDGARPTFQHFTSLGTPSSSHSYKLQREVKCGLRSAVRRRFSGRFGATSKALPEV